MKNILRKILWKILGYKHEIYLNNQKHITYLDNFSDSKIGNKTYNNGAKIWKWNTNSKLTIGNYCSIANDVNFILDSGNHDMFRVTTSPLFHNLFKSDEYIKYEGKELLFSEFKTKYEGKKHSIVIKNEVWIGAGATILPGVTIGNGAIVLAGSVVTKSVSDFSIVGGIPAQHLNYRYTTNQIEKLNKINWWNWTDEKVKFYVTDFNLDIEEFIKRHYNSEN